MNKNPDFLAGLTDVGIELTTQLSGALGAPMYTGGIEIFVPLDAHKFYQVQVKIQEHMYLNRSAYIQSAPVEPNHEEFSIKTASGVSYKFRKIKEKKNYLTLEGIKYELVEVFTSYFAMITKHKIPGLDAITSSSTCDSDGLRTWTYSSIQMGRKLYGLKTVEK